MRSGRLINNRKGMYIAEASLILPVFLMAFFLLIRLIPIFAVCENITYAAAEEMRFENAKAAFRSNPARLPMLLEVRALAENDEISSFRITGLHYRYEKGGMEDLITVSFRAGFRSDQDLIRAVPVVYRGKVTGRAFSGKRSEGEPDEALRGSIRVWIFPDGGERYHTEFCTYVRANAKQCFLSQDLARRYHACPNCRAKKASLGDPVYVFEANGEAYHTAECRAVKRRCVEVSRDRAEELEYTPCSKCGGVHG